MSDTVRSISPRACAGAPHPPPQRSAAQSRAHSLHNAYDPVTEWLLEQPQLDATEFAVLFAVHQLNARWRRSAWIRRGDLCRSSGLSQVPLTRVLSDLRQKGLVGMSRHPTDSSRACYMLIVS